MKWRAAVILSMALVPTMSPVAVNAARQSNQAGAGPVRPPRAEVEPVDPAAGVRRDTTVRVTLNVRLPAGLHVQSNQPRDPALIPTTLTLTPPAGVTVVDIGYPKPTDFRQSGQAEPLAVFEQAFSISVGLKIDRAAPAGRVVVPARFRYQACDATVCFAPRREETQWTLDILTAK